MSGLRVWIPTPSRCRICIRICSPRAPSRARGSTTSTPSRSPCAGGSLENAVLSHDLLEGLFARAAVASDVEVVEHSPDRYDVIVSREHRWARGDWQLLPWLRPALSWPRAQRAVRSVSALGRWKLLDNLRRTRCRSQACGAGSGVAAAASAVQHAVDGAAGVWTWRPPLLPILIAVRDRPRHLRRESERQALRHDVRIACLRWALAAHSSPIAPGGWPMRLCAP